MSNGALWNAEYKSGGIPSSVRDAPSNVVVDFIAFCNLTSGCALDIGCGQGRNSFYLAQKGFSVSSMDIADTAVASVQKSAQEQNLPVAAMVQDLREPWPLQDAIFDVAIDAYCFKHVIEKSGIANYIHELTRVLKPGGLFLLYLASTADGYYRRFPEDDQHGPGVIIRDPGNNILSRLYDTADISALFKSFSILRADKKPGRNEMHGQAYDRESIVFYLKKK